MAGLISNPVTTKIEKKCGQYCMTDGKCECCISNKKSNKDTCKCEASCKCKVTNVDSSSMSGKPDDCKNLVDCIDGSSNILNSTDPTSVGLVTDRKYLGPTLIDNLEKPHCKESDDKIKCEGKNHEPKKESREQCRLSGNCDGSKKDTSLAVWQPNQGSSGGSSTLPISPEQREETYPKEEELKPCAHPKEDVHKQEEHQKMCSPLPQGDKLKAILFDIDGTIADSDPIHFLAFQEVLGEAGYNGGVPISHEFFIRQMSGKLNYVIAEELMPEMEEKKRIEMMDEKEARYRKLAAKDLQPIPGFIQFSQYVKNRGLRRAAVTNSPRLNAEQVIAALNIPDFFEIVVVGSECDNPKPYPDPYLKAINFLGVEPNQCFVLEDSPSGIKAGRAAGSAVVGLLTGHPGPVLRDNGASVLIQDYHDSALWIALGEKACAQNACSKSHDSTPSTGVPPPIPVST